MSNAPNYTTRDAIFDAYRSAPEVTHAELVKSKGAIILGATTESRAIGLADGLVEAGFKVRRRGRWIMFGNELTR
jgi:hypothetical protein